MDNLPIQFTPWSDRLAMDMALFLEGSGDTRVDLLHRHALSPGDIIRYTRDPVFLMKVNSLREEIKEKGLTFRLKARAQAEELLITSWGLIHSPEVSPTVKEKLIANTIRWGGLEPQKNTGVVDLPSGGVSITINLDKAVVAPPVSPVIEHAN